MAIEHTTRDVRRRFCQEQEHIERYTRYLHAKSAIHDHQVVELNRILQRVLIDPLPVRRYDRIASPYSPEEIAELLAAIAKAEPEVYQTILGHEQRLDDSPSFELDGPAAGQLDRLDEWVDYLMERLSDDAEDQEVDAALRNATCEAQELDLDLDEEDRIPPEALRALLITAADHAMHAKVRQRVDAMVYAREMFDEIEVLSRVARPDAEVNVLRQGFLLLMTAFDAAVFDLVRIAFRKKFFQLVGVFGRQEKVSLEAIGQARSFGALRDRIIEQQLKKRYIKDLLIQLQSLGVGLVDQQRPDGYAQLVELVLRRNVHVHSRGVVDKRYLECDQQTAKSSFNVYNLSLGEAAVIDEAYWESANRLCKGLRRARC